MHLLAAWKALGTLDLLRLLGIPAAVMCAALLPGRNATRAAALAVALATALLIELSAPWYVRAGWPCAWLLVAWQAGAAGDGPGDAQATVRRGAFESGMLALPLGLGLVLLLLAATSRQLLGATDARLASLGALVLGAGLLHLMLRRHVRRALVAFAALGLGLELLAAAVRSADALHAGPPAGGALGGTLVALALTLRIAGSRERYAHSPLVSDAHELHD
jgi:hypothetical protein